MWSFLEFRSFIALFFIMFGVYVPQINNFFLIHNFVFLCFCFYMRFDHFLYILTSFLMSLSSTLNYFVSELCYMNKLPLPFLFYVPNKNYASSQLFVSLWQIVWHVSLLLLYKYLCMFINDISMSIGLHDTVKSKRNLTYILVQV